MSYRELYVEEAPLRFAGITVPYERARYVVIGVPFDSTSSYRPGSRFAPLHVREASLNIESNSLLGLEAFIEDAPIYDSGDLAVVHGDPGATLERLSIVVSEIAGEGKIPVLIGGEHTLTAGAARGLARTGLRPCFVVFDAHLDLRDEYLGVRLSHACALRRSLEASAGAKAVVVGARAYSREEMEYVEASRGAVKVYTPIDVERLGPRNVAREIRSFLSQCRHVYLSFDIDAIDPSEAPGTGTPEPMGLTARDALLILASVIDRRLVAADLVEVNPLLDASGITSVLGARIVQEVILLAEASRARG
ncbi:MAG: agmatinase [Desulfurococcales archaeon]|nr:agmatinase [Desulfurococcales archaeon]